MAGSRIPGPYSTVAAGDETVIRPAGQPVITGAGYISPGHVGERGLTPEQQELALDVLQLTLDIIGIFEPTPFSDGANALISLGRSDWVGAGLSGLGMIPYLGDLAKAGKLPRYAAKIRKAVDLARENADFARYVRPAIEKLKSALDTIPTAHLSPKLRSLVDEIKKPLDSFMGGGATKNLDGAGGPPRGGGGGGGGRPVGRAPGDGPWWEVENVEGLIDGTSIPKKIRMRVDGRRWEIARDAVTKKGTDIGPATKHLGERARDASAGAKYYQVDYPMSSVAGALEEFEKRLRTGMLLGKNGKPFKAGDEIRDVIVGGFELGIDTSKDPWRVFHLVLK